jgi:hypothetical protein
LVIDLIVDRERPQLRLAFSQKRFDPIGLTSRSLDSQISGRTMIENGGLVTKPTIITASLPCALHDRFDALNAELRRSTEQRLHRRRPSNINQFDVKIVHSEDALSTAIHGITAEPEMEL